MSDATVNTDSLEDFPYQGVSQESRILEAQNPDFIHLEERSDIDLLHFSVAFSKEVKYYNLKNETQDDEQYTWESFLIRDELVLLSVITRFALKDQEDAFNAEFEEAYVYREEKLKSDKLKECAEMLQGILRIIDKWNRNFSLQNDPKGAVYEFNSRVSGSLSKDLRELLHYDSLAGRSNAIGFNIGWNFEGLSERWNLETRPQDDFRNIFSGMEDKNAGLNTYLLKIRAVYTEFLDTIAFLQTIAEDYLERILTEDQNNKPHIALFIAFLRILKFPQDMLNTITKRHLNHYYLDILQQTRKPVLEDEVFVYFEAAKDVDSYYIPADMKLLAGKDENGRSQYYAITQSLEINQGKIADLRTLFVARNERIQRDPYPIHSSDGNETRLITGVFSSQETPNSGKTWPTLGEDQYSISDRYRTMDHARLGFVMAFPELALAESWRTVDLRLVFREESFEDSFEMISNVAKGEGYQPGYFFFKTFYQALKVSLTTETGWLEIPRYKVYLEKENRTIGIRLDLSPDDPAITNYLQAVHQEPWPDTWPSIKVELKDKGAVYGYSFLQGLVLENAFIDVSVTESSDLVLYNQVGLLSQDTPFYPFTPVPTKESYLLIGHREAFQKKLNKLELNLEWNNLPDLKKGFEDYYEGYNLGITNSSFKVKLSALSQGRWAPGQKHAQEHELFEYDLPDEFDDGEYLHPETHLDKIDLSHLPVTTDLNLPNPLVYDNRTQRGFLRMSFSAPSFAFAHANYSQILSDVLVKNAKNTVKDREDLLLPVPKTPFAPELKKISLNYQSTGTLYPDEETSQDNPRTKVPKFYHLHPFGHQEHAVNSAKVANEILPHYEDEGNLFIGLTGVKPPSFISFLLFIAEGSVNDTLDRDIPEVEWRYLSGSEWKEFKREDVLSDSTENFIRSGVVRLYLPEDISLNHTRMPDNIYWIRASIRRDAHFANWTDRIFPHAARARWVKDELSLQHLDQPIPAGTISGVVGTPKAIASVNQPRESFGARGIEPEKVFYTRISERLRHKRRAVTIWDYQRLVLEKFPFIYKVKCLTSKYDDPDFPPGTVTIIVIPMAYDKRVSNPLRPKVGISVLKDIREHLLTIAPPFVKINVRNPFYERVRVICKVKFTDRLRRGYYQQQLNKDIRNFLTPWLNDSEQEEKFGGSIFKSDILGFVENRPYISFVTGFSVLKTTGENGNFELVDTARLEEQSQGDFSFEELKCRYPWSILTSASNHQIEVIDEVGYDAPMPKGIKNMELGTDFIIDKRTPEPVEAEPEADAEEKPEITT